MTLSTEIASERVHPTAVISPNALLGHDNIVGPYAVIGPGVRLGNGNQIGPHTVIVGSTDIGDENRIFQFASIGSPPQDLKWRGEDSRLIIGNRNTVREYVTLQPGTADGGGITSIGNDNLFMASSHVAHDCNVGNHVHLANVATLAGHITVGDYAILSGLCAVHQHARIGAYSFVAGGAMVSQDVPPYCLVQGDRARLVSLNEVGLKRNGFNEAEVLALRRAFRALFKHAGTRADRMAAAEVEAGWCIPGRHLLDFVASSKRGLVAV